MNEPGYDHQNDLNELLQGLCNHLNLPPDARAEILGRAAGAMMECYHHGYHDASIGAPSKVIFTPTEERNTDRDWTGEPTAGELGIASPTQLTPEDYDDDISRWGADGGPVSA